MHHLRYLLASILPADETKRTLAARGHREQKGAGWPAAAPEHQWQAGRARTAEWPLPQGKEGNGYASSVLAFQGAAQGTSFCLSSMTLVWVVISWIDTKSLGNKSKNGQVVLHQTQKLLHSKGNNRVKKQPVNGRK